MVHKFVAIPNPTDKAIITMGLVKSCNSRNVHSIANPHHLILTEEAYPVSTIIPSGEVKGCVAAEHKFDTVYPPMFLTEICALSMFCYSDGEQPYLTVPSLTNGHLDHWGNACWGGVILEHHNIKTMWSKWWNSRFYYPFATLAGADIYSLQASLVFAAANVDTITIEEPDCDGIFVSDEEWVLRMAGKDVIIKHGRKTITIQQDDGSWKVTKRTGDPTRVVIGQYWNGENKTKLIKLQNGDHEKLLIANSKFDIEEFNG